MKVKFKAKISQSDLLVALTLLGKPVSRDVLKVWEKANIFQTPKKEGTKVFYSLPRETIIWANFLAFYRIIKKGGFGYEELYNTIFRDCSFFLPNGEKIAKNEIDKMIPALEEYGRLLTQSSNAIADGHKLLFVSALYGAFGNINSINSEEVIRRERIVKIGDEMLKAEGNLERAKTFGAALDLYLLTVMKVNEKLTFDKGGNFIKPKTKKEN